MNRPKTILMVTEFPTDNPAGGIGTMMRTLSRDLEDDGRVIILRADWDSPELGLEPDTSPAIYTLRIRPPYIRGGAIIGLLVWLVAFIPMVRRLARLLRDESVDIVHLHYASSFQYIFRIAKWITGTPYVLTLHRGDVISFPNLKWPDRILTRFAIGGARSVVSVSGWLATQAENAIGPMPNPVVIPNGLDTDGLDTLIADDFAFPEDISPPDTFFLMVSNVAYYKAQDIAIRAWAELQNSHPDIPLLIVGEKRELWDTCVQLIAELGCEDRVQLLGAQPRAVALNLMRRATGLIFPSRSEGLPYVLLEAGALGTPVICSDIGPFVDVVEDEQTALVTPVEDHAAIANAARRLLTEPDLGPRLGAGLSATVRRDYTAKRMAEQYSALYEKVLP